MKDDDNSAIQRLISRRRFVQMAAAGTAITAIGGVLYVASSDDLTAAAQKQKLPDGRPRLPPGQRVIEALKPMGGTEGDPSPAAFQLRVHGEVEAARTFDFDDLLDMPQVERAHDVHCVTGWSCLDPVWTGVQVKYLAEQVGLKSSARFVVFEAAHGYTANVPLEEALKPNVLIAHRLDGDPLEHWHGGPARAVVPDLYFWKSSKWITGIKFVEFDEPGYWEVRGYHNYADPWQEQRYS